MIASHRFPMYKPKDGVLDLDYLLYFFKTPLGKHLLGLASPGGAGRNKTLGQKDFGKTRIPLPLFREQKQMVEIILKWDESIKLTEHLIINKKKRQKAILEKILMPPSKNRINSKEWQKVTLGEIGKMLKGKGITKKELTPNGMPCIRYGEIYSQHHFYLKEFKSYIPQEILPMTESIFFGDILLAGSGESIEEIGKAIAYCKEDKAYAGGDIIILRPQIKVNSIYISLALSSSYSNRQKRKMGQGNSVVHIYSSSLKNLNIWMPSISTQNQIAEIFIEIDKEIEILNLKLSNLKKQKIGLIQQLLIGKIRVLK